MVKIGSLTAEILLIWTNVTRTDVAWTNVTATVGICSRCSQGPMFKVWSRCLWFGEDLDVRTEMFLEPNDTILMSASITPERKDYVMVLLKLSSSFNSSLDEI